MSERAAVAVPMPWHRQHLADLLQQHSAARLPHALLLSGPAGLGKAQFGQALMQALVCQQPVSSMACGHCQSCHLAVAGSHPDTFVLEPEEGKRVIKIDQVRQLVAFCGLTAQMGTQRVALIQPAESMNRNAQNALLKTLEEPGAGTLLILLSHQPSLLLPTVRSRCQHRLLTLTDSTQASAWLAEQVGSEDHARLLLQAAAGAPLRARELDGAGWFADRVALLGHCLSVLEGRMPASQAALQLKEYGVADMLDALYSWLHQAATMTKMRAETADAQMLPLYRRLRGRCGQVRLMDVAGTLLDARRGLSAGSNPNPELLLEGLLLKLAGVDGDQVAF